ncbi:hypothetical protein [Ornithinibacillus californiensis]|uniref:hypothetical protein n=1 Tax=Ornithinibacillus californiensis TaxID=161536 RepID=UPI00069D343D|nr:hypothetical protein [Ornithinibacillus californiensis]
MHQQVKESMNEIIGSNHIFSEEKQKQTLLKIKNKKTRKKTFQWYRLTPVLGLTAFLLAGTLLFSIYNQGDNHASNIPEKSNEPANEEPVVIAGEETRVIEIVSRLEDKAIELEEENSELRNELEFLAYKFEDTLEDAKLERTIYPGTDNNLEILGYHGTSEDVITDLVNRPDVIPVDGILGGTMRFNPNGIYVLSHKHVYAEFDDGHTGGYLLLEYHIVNGEIQWDIIDMYEYGDESKE